MAYKRLLNELPLVNYNTLRKLLLHLKIVAQHADKNMMSTQNLAAIFGPTLFSVEGVSDHSSWGPLGAEG